MNILFICTSNKDRSPALEEYYRENYSNSGHQFRSAGVNKYFTEKHGSHFLESQDVEWIMDNGGWMVFAEEVHLEVFYKMFPEFKRSISDSLISKEDSSKSFKYLMLPVIL